MNINQILLWAGPDQLPLSFYWNRNDNHADAAHMFVYVWFICLVCVRLSSANMSRYNCLGRVSMIALLRFVQWNLSSTIKRGFPFQCSTRFETGHSPSRLEVCGFHISCSLDKLCTHPPPPPAILARLWAAVSFTTIKLDKQADPYLRVWRVVVRRPS